MSCPVGAISLRSGRLVTLTGLKACPVSPSLRRRPIIYSAQQPKEELAGAQNEASAPEEDSKPVLSYALNENFAAEELMEELKDKKQFGKRGEVVVLMQIVTSILAIFPPMKLYGVVYFAGVLSLIFGCIISLYAIVNLGRSFSPLVSPRKNNSIVTTGLYQYMRHPLYVAFIMLAFGLSAVCYDESRLMLSCLLAFILNYKAKKEEEAMLEKHGQEYQDYMNDVSRFVPTF